MAVKKEIVSKMETITEVMITDNNMFFIPDFQRSFVWGKEEITQLFDDFAEDTDYFRTDTSDLEGYLLGNIVLIEQDDGPAMVIDGQQRLTTITLIFRALTNIVNAKALSASSEAERRKWVKKIGDLMKGYCVLNDDDEFQSLRLMHDASLKFGSYYNKLFIDPEEGDDSYDGVGENDIETAEDANIHEVYTYAYEYIQGIDDNQLNKFINYFRNKVKLIVTSAPTEAKAFQLFEILNDRGRSLEPMDLIKNTFLKVLHLEVRPKNTIDQFVGDWQETVSNLQVGKKKLSSSSFLKQYILSYCGENIQAKDLFDFIKNSKKGPTNGTEIIKFAKGMKKASKLLNKIEGKDYSDFKSDQNTFILFQLLGIKQFYPILILLVDSADEKKSKIMDVLVRYGAAIVFSFTQTNTIEKELPEIIKDYLSKKSNAGEEVAFKTLYDALNEKIKQTAILTKEVVAERNFVGRGEQVHSKALQLLRFIELYFNNNTIVQTIPRGKKLTAEHIQSQHMDPTDFTLADLGYASEEERKAFLHRMGNLTILFNGDNASIGNNKFVDKKSCYSGCDFIITSTIVEEEKTTQKHGKDTTQCEQINKYEKQYGESPEGHWTKNMIIQRSNDLADLVYKILVDDID